MSNINFISTWFRSATSWCLLGMALVTNINKILCYIKLHLVYIYKYLKLNI